MRIEIPHRNTRWSSTALKIFLLKRAVVHELGLVFLDLRCNSRFDFSVDYGRGSKKKGISRLWARSAWYLGIFAVLLMVFRPHEIPSQRAETFDEEPADVKLLWQLLHVPAIFIGFLPLFFESYSG